MAARGQQSEQGRYGDRRNVDGRGHARHRSAGLVFGAVLLGCGLAFPVPAAFAQNSSAPAASGQAIRFSIPALPLGEAVDAFSGATGWQVGYSDAVSGAVRTRAVSGSMPPRQALQKMFAGTGVRVRITGPSSAALINPQSSAVEEVDETAEILPTVSVTGESAWGEVDGYIATQSATGTKTGVPLIETPISINVVSRDQVEAQGAQRIYQALRYTPGITADVRGDISRFDTVYFRGMGSVTDTFQYLDGLRLPRGASYLSPQIDPFLLERVEVLKGPASVLYGQAPLGGILNLMSKRPTEETFHEVQLSAGSYNRFEAGFDTGGPITEDGKLLYRLTGLGLMSDTSVNYTEEQRIAVAPAVTWNPNAETSLTFLTHYQRDPKGGFYGVLPSSGTILPNPYGPIPRDFFDGSPYFNDFDRTQIGVGYDFDHAFNDRWSVHQDLRYRYMELSHSQVGSSGLQADYRTLNRYALWSDETINSFNVDTRLQGEIDTGPVKHTAVFGVDYQWDNWQQTQGYGGAPTLDIVNPDYNQTITRPAAYTSPDRTENLIGLYVQDQLKIDRFNFLLAGRYDWADIENDNAMTGQYSEQIFNKFTWRAGAMYNLDMGLAPYASYSTSFDPTITTNPYGAPFEPTTGQQFEVGIKYKPQGFDGIFTLAAFDLTQQNVLTQDPSPGAPFNAYVQTGEIRSRGIEFEAKFSPVQGLNLIAGATWLDAEVTKSNSANLGKVPVSVPEVTASGWADYTLQSGPLEGLTFGAGVRYVGKTYADEANTLEVPSYVVGDALLGYDFGKLDRHLDGLELALNVTNVTDEVYYTCNGTNFCNYGQGRTVLATMKYRW